MKKPKVNEVNFLGMDWKSIAAGLISFLITNPIKNKVVAKKVMNDPKIKKMIKNLTDEALELEKEVAELTAFMDKVEKGS
tara:strand:+ start:77 stop:316 length:240 start_codon:yes stop_codon:yes gene_type:complete